MKIYLSESTVISKEFTNFSVGFELFSFWVDELLLIFDV